MARELKCGYNMCSNLGVAVNPVKYKNKYYCKECLEQIKLKEKIRDKIFELLPKEIVTRVNTAVKQWIEKGHSPEYILYTLEYIKLNKCVLNFVHGIQYYLINKEIEEAYISAKTHHELKKIEQEGFEISTDEIGFSYNSNDDFLNIL